MGKKEKVKSNPHSKIDPIMPGHIGQVLSVEFEPAEKKNFRSLPGSVLEFKLKLEDFDRSKQIARVKQV
jgi:hypothetical protein